MGIVELQKEFLKIENIDRIKVKFLESSNYLKNDDIIYLNPELFIIKNIYGRILFNAIVDRLKNLDSWKEKGLDYIQDNSGFPYFILSMDMITCGILFGYWAHYGNDTLKLYNEILLEDQKCDYDRFITDIEHIFKI